MTTTAPALDRQYRGPGRRVLTAVEFDVLWEWLGLGATPVVLRLDSPGRTHAERRGIVATGWQGLRQRGLADINGPDPEVVRLMHLLAVPSRQVELRMRLGRELRVVAAGHPGATALAVRQDATVTLSSATGPVGAALGALPPARPGPAHAVALPSADLEAATAEAGQGGGRTLAEALAARGLTEDDAEQVEAILHATSRRGQLSVLAADHWGVLHRLRKVVGVLDTRHGRYLMQRATAADGVEWTTLAPTDTNRLHARLDTLLAEAEADAGRI
ncbi:ESX secretion-associated protein EspG [Pseudonocardia acaciae]|uniref:ESX secretion-associated protein EspG n=1 Tax=Pseudonocardia acaciae TaxID=551276 RepID=UPI00048CE39B|nr:ESX secretion-associated protein EspG [Pseudonocardia acaciae]